jgi:tetratricopeptide (TPR) repeat protein
MGKRSRRRHKRVGLTGERLRAVRAEVEALLEEGRTEAAKEALLRFDARHPGHAEIMEELADLAQETDDMQYMQAAMEGLLPRRPEAPELLLMLGAAALRNHYPATALKASRSLLARWPGHPGADDARRVVRELEAALPEQGMGVALQHERIQHLLSLGLTRQAREAARALHAAQPQFSAALNNLGTAAWMDGDYAEAEAAFRKVLAAEPDNVHALAGLIRVLLLSGHGEEARALAERLKDSTAPASERWPTVALALSYLGDDEGVLWAFEQARREGILGEDFSGARLRHMAAVAALRRGDSKQARRLWEKALKQVPGMAPARRNLEALDVPAPLRPVPWAIELDGWLPPEKWKAFLRSVEPEEGTRSPHVEEKVLERFPELRSLAPLLLDRGEPAAVTLVLALCEFLAGASRLDDLLAAELKRFCLGERSHIADRIRAGRVLLEAGAAREEELQLWTGQRRQPYGWFDIELYDEPVRRHSPEVEELAESAHDLLQSQQGKEAEQVLQKALTLEPDAPDLLHNLAVARLMQGRRKESERLSEETHRRWPDYLFARCAVAQLRVRQSRLGEAWKLLEPLLAQRRLHVSEFAALCAAHMDLLIAEGDREAALVWLDLLEDFLPDHPFVEIYSTRLGARPPLRGLMRGLFGDETVM